MLGAFTLGVGTSYEREKGTAVVLPVKLSHAACALGLQRCMQDSDFVDTMQRGSVECIRKQTDQHGRVDARDRGGPTQRRHVHARKTDAVDGQNQVVAETD